VFRAYQPGRERLVAVKVFRLDLSPEQAAALVRALEQLIARNIQHPAIAAPIAAGLDGNTAYLAMEYAVGDSLDVTARAHPMPLRDVASIVDAVAGALERGVGHGVRHGRLHPRDIIVSPDGARVTGLGVAEALSSVGMSAPARRPYAAPEVPSDVYSLAAIAYELLSGRRMTPGGWDELSAENGPELRNAFAAALSEDPHARPRAGDFAAIVRKAVRSTADESRVADDLGFGRPITSPGFEAEVDAAALDRFADLGTGSDLQMEFAEQPPPIEPMPAATPLPPSWTAQPPKLFQADEPGARARARSRRGLKWAIVLLIVLIACFGGGYALRTRFAHQSAATQALPTKQPVTSTTVDLPPAHNPANPTASAQTPVPRASTLPAPAPSRPASGASPEPARTATGRGRLLIRSTPADAIVTINGHARGKTPLAVRDLPLGSYTIHLAREGYDAVDRQERLTAKRPSASLAVSLKQTGAGSRGPAPSGARSSESRGSIAIESRPAGARVLVNDRLAGSTPLAIPALPAGPAKVRIEMDGYQPWATMVQVKAGERTVVTASLDRR
jgi:serine/threonine-protein kinase